MNLKIKSKLPGVRYSAIAAPTAGEEYGTRIAIDPEPQIPRHPRGVSAHRALAYRDGFRLDLLIPAEQGTYPLVIYLPGGGFVVAPRRMAGKERAFIAASGYAVASVEYRTTRHRATYADGLADIRAAISYLTGRAGEFGIDSHHIAVWGESAGGYLASLAGLHDPRIGAVVDMFGASDLRRVADGFDAPTRAAVADLRHPIHRYRATEANPIDLVRAGAPPFLLMHGDDDRIIPPTQTLRLHQALRDAGASSTRYLLADAGHGRMSLSWRQAQQWTSVQVMTIIKDFLDQHLRS
jgi:acetyl esterase/lipase